MYVVMKPGNEILAKLFKFREGESSLVAVVALKEAIDLALMDESFFFQ